MAAMNAPTRRLFGMPVPIVLLAGLALIVTALVVLYLLHVRSDVLMPDQLRIFFYLYLMLDYPAGLLSILVLAIGLVPSLQRLGVATMVAIGDRPFLTAAIAFAGFAAGSLWIYHAHPLCMDEYAPYLQSEVFASGRLTGRLPVDLVDWLVVPGFQKVFLQVSHTTGAVASVYLPGFALLLAPFKAIGLPWLANPLVGALSVLVLHRLTLELLESRLAAGGAVLMALASPAFTINALSFYSMPAHLLCNAVFTLLLLKPTPLRALAAGAVGGLAINLHNPLPHALYAAPWLIWLLTRPDRWRLAAAVSAGYLPWLAVMLGWQHLLASMDSAAPAAGGAGVAGGVLQALVAKVQQVLVAPNESIVTVRMIGLSKLWVWAVPALVLAAFVGFWNRRGDVRFQLLAWSAVLTLAGFLFVPFDQGHGWGYRYFHSAWLVLPIFAAAAFVPAQATESSERGSRAIAAYMGAAALGSLAILTTYFGWQVEAFMARHLRQVPQAGSGSPQVIILDGAWGYYAFDLVQNDPFMRGPVTMLVTHGPDADREVMNKHFPGLVLLGGDYRGQVWGTRETAPPR